MKRIEIYALISGLVFLISGIAKAIDISVFSNAITQYGFEYVQYLSPLIILTETSIGLSLIFQIQLKRISLISIILLLLFTFIYSYGIIFKGVEDCGCFGKISVLNNLPVITFIRNGILLYMLIAIWKKGENINKLNQWIIGVFLMVLCLVSFMSGYTYRFVNKTTVKQKYKARAMVDTPLKEFITTSKDSTYLVFAFTYTCPHCLNSIENLKQYETSGVVDKVIGIAVENSVAEKQFKEIFKPEFSIKNYPPKIFFRLTNTFPTVYYIKNDSVMAVLSGELPCSYVFKQMK